MARSNVYGVGGNMAVRGDARIKGTLVTVAGLAQSYPLLIQGMPYLNLWFHQDAPLGVGLGATITLQVASGALTSAATPFKAAQDAWLPVWTAVAAPGVDTIPFAPGGFLYNGSKARISVVPAGVAQATVRFVLSCSA